MDVEQIESVRDTAQAGYDRHPNTGDLWTVHTAERLLRLASPPNV